MEPGEEPAEDLMTVVARFVSVLRKLGTEQMRSNTQLSSTVEDAVEGMEAIRRAILGERDRAVLAENRNETFANILIGQIDFLDRTAELMAKIEGLEAWTHQMTNGVRLLLKEASKAGLTEIAEAGDPFNSSFHDPVGKVRGSEDGTNLVVSRVVQRGFQLDGRVLRRATVELTSSQHNGNGV